MIKSKNTVKALPVWSLSLGCPKNRVDSERLIGSLGMPIKACGHIGGSRLVFINTCAFIEPAVRESIRAILDVIESIKKLKHKPLLTVAGCMVGRYGQDELARELPEVDLWLPTDQLENWPTMLKQALGLKSDAVLGRLLSTGPAYAWLKISEGCRHKCSFCSIPSIRGGLRSEPDEKVLAEARYLLSEGVRELVLVAQDVTSWGQDFKSQRQKCSSSALAQNGLVSLLRKLAILPDLAWLRLMYLYPGSITDELLLAIAEIGSPLLPYLDLPFQHSEPDILASMGRPFKCDNRNVVERIRKYLPDAALRGTLIVGYPGESDEHFKNLCDFVREVRFHNLGVFAYCAEEGTLAATFPDQVPQEIKEERRAEIMTIQAEISRQILEDQLGRRMMVLVDGELNDEWPGLHSGRVWFQAPEVDGLTYVSGPGVKPGAFVECDIEDSKTYDLVALA